MNRKQPELDPCKVLKVIFLCCLYILFTYLILDDLFQMLNQERIERVSVRSQANYLPNQLPAESKALIEVSRKMGKWNQFGHMQNGLLYLHPHEALHLIEMVINIWFYSYFH